MSSRTDPLFPYSALFRSQGKLHAVAHDVVLIGEDVERVFRFQRLQLARRHREGVVAEIDLLRVLVIFIHREIDDPAEAEGVLLDQAQFLPNAGACKSGELRRVLFLACGEKYAVVEAKAKRCDQLCRAFLAVILGEDRRSKRLNSSPYCAARM